MEIIQQQIFDQERALYGSRDLLVKDCSFDGPADGESAFKECSDIQVERCFFNLRYPFWHDHGLKLSGSELTAPFLTDAASMTFLLSMRPHPTD